MQKNFSLHAEKLFSPCRKIILSVQKKCSLHANKISYKGLTLCRTPAEDAEIDTAVTAVLTEAGV